MQPINGSLACLERPSPAKQEWNTEELLLLIDAILGKVHTSLSPSVTSKGTERVNAPKDLSLKGTLIKPKSNNEGSLAILIPAAFAKGGRAKILIRDYNGNAIDEGRFTSFGEDGKRAKFSFKKPGSAYPEKVIVEITAGNGAKIELSDMDLGKRSELH